MHRFLRSPGPRPPGSGHGRGCQGQAAESTSTRSSPSLDFLKNSSSHVVSRACIQRVQSRPAEGSFVLHAATRSYETTKHQVLPEILSDYVMNDYGWYPSSPRPLSLLSPHLFSCHIPRLDTKRKQASGWVTVGCWCQGLEVAMNALPRRVQEVRMRKPLVHLRLCKTKLV